MTDYIAVSKSSPGTTFFLEADRLGQSIAGNYTTVRLYLRCRNDGNASSFSNFVGQHIGSIDGIGTFGVHGPVAPFLPSGVAGGATRWRDGPYDVNIPHGPDGTRAPITLRQGLYYDNGAVAQDNTATFSDFPPIPRGPQVEFDAAWGPSLLSVEFDGAWVPGLLSPEYDGAWVA